MKYLMFKDKHFWILPVYEKSEIARNPEGCFSKNIKFAGQVSKKEYDEQFKYWKQRELF